MSHPLAPDLRACWESVLHLDRGLLEASPGPLAGFQETAEFFGITPLPALRFEPMGVKDLAVEKPTFQGLTEPRLLALRRQTYTGQELEVVARWAETALRFCEVRLSSLEQRAAEKCGDAASAKAHVLHLASFLLDHGTRAGDARFLNTVLKLIDRRWLFQRSAMRRGLAGSGNTLVTSLFQLRLLLASERAVLELTPGARP